MKSRTSFFDKTVLKKDLTRFFPLWALYLIGGLLIMHILSGFYGGYYANWAFTAARDLNALIGPMGLVNAGYAFLAAQLLFGDLHSTRLCYGIHALPLRREGWYLTHVASGVLIGFVPPLVIVITLLPVLSQFWFTGFLCWGALSLHYLFFFGLATFCMMATGNRFAATAIYGILNFLSLIIHWFAKTIYIPLLPGVRATGDIFGLLSPPVTVVQLSDFFRVKHLEDCSQCYKTGNYPDIWQDVPHEYGYLGLGESWGYLLILAGVGLVLLGLGLLLYRVRHLERAGDFVAFKSMKPIFLAVYSLCVAGGMFFFGENFGDISTGYFFLVIGLFLGYFTGRMLLERTVRVFNRKGFIGMGILYGAVILSLLLTWADPIGISRHIPDNEKVEHVYLFEGHLSDYQLNNYLPNRSDVIVVTDPADIAEITQIHSRMLHEHKNPTGRGHYFTISYRMKNGTSVSRTYLLHNGGKASQSLRKYMTKPQYLFGADSLERLQASTDYLDLSTVGEVPEILWPELLKAMWLDAQNGQISLSSNLLSDKPIALHQVQIQTARGGYRVLYFTDDAAYLSQWMQQHRSDPQLLTKSPSLAQLIAGTHHIYFDEQDQVLPSTLYKEFLTLLWEDCKTGNVKNTGKWNSGFHVEMRYDNYSYTLELDRNSQSAQWLAAFTAG